MVSAVQRGDDFVSGLTDMLGGGTYKLGVGIAPTRHVTDGILAGVHSPMYLATTYATLSASVS